jgi:hypothetical protein
MPGKFDQETFDRNIITTFVQAYPKELVLDVLKTIFVDKHKARKSAGWELWKGPESDPPNGIERVKINNKWYIRSEEAANAARASMPSMDKGQKQKRTEKTDTTVRKSDMHCPTCRGELFREPICRGCKEGKAGYRVRLICGENDEHTWIV